MPRTRVKICGITCAEDAHRAADAGADAIGMILYAAGAHRQIDADVARKIAMGLPPFVSAVGVVRDCPPNRLRQLGAHIPLDAMQLHGRETFQDARSLQPMQVIRMIPARPGFEQQIVEWSAAIIPNLGGLLIESPGGGGSGIETDWSLVEPAFTDAGSAVPLIAAGGLTPETVGDVVRRLRPWGVDVSSGVEDGEGRKSLEKMTQFVDAIRAADAA
jgi:phosphoribosylanthranilate isomerase